MAKYRYPVNYIAITTYFKKGVHNGLDLGWNSKHGGKNQPIYAVADGKVYSTKDKDKTYKWKVVKKTKKVLTIITVCSIILEYRKYSDIAQR